jgi:hypothetical protein
MSNGRNFIQIKNYVHEVYQSVKRSIRSGNPKENHPIHIKNKNKIKSIKGPNCSLF